MAKRSKFGSSTTAEEPDDDVGEDRLDTPDPDAAVDDPGSATSDAQVEYEILVSGTIIDGEIYDAGQTVTMTEEAAAEQMAGGVALKKKEQETSESSA